MDYAIELTKIDIIKEEEVSVIQKIVSLFRADNDGQASTIAKSMVDVWLEQETFWGTSKENFRLLHANPVLLEKVTNLSNR
jgi:hypothetical protein